MPTKKKAPKEEIEDVPEDLAELGDDDLDEDVLGDEEDLVGDVDVDDDDDVLVEVEIEEIDELLVAEPAAVVEPSGDKADDDDDEEDEPEDEDVEASLDVILKERLVVEDEPEDEEVPDTEDRAEGTERVLPKQPDEFVCRSCFLVKHPSQLADKKKMLCRDCV
jgi:Domain of unknown function (DUF4193)